MDQAIAAAKISARMTGLPLLDRFFQAYFGWKTDVTALKDCRARIESGRWVLPSLHLKQMTVRSGRRDLGIKGLMKNGTFELELSEVLSRDSRPICTIELNKLEVVRRVSGYQATRVQDDIIRILNPRVLSLVRSREA